jgi:hypothetical protein
MAGTEGRPVSLKKIQVTYSKEVETRSPIASEVYILSRQVSRRTSVA